MSKVTLKVDIEEDYLESIKASTNKTSSDIILINATPITESDDCVSRQTVLKQLRGCLTGGETEYQYVKLHIDSIPPVLPKRERGEWIYTPEKHIVDETDDEVVYATENRCSCSACGHKYGFCKMNDAYCRYCGAEMR